MSPNQQKIIDRLNSLSAEQQLEAAWQFNHWFWPEIIIDLKPTNIKMPLNSKEQSSLFYHLTIPIMEYFRNKFGEQESLRYHNVRSKTATMTNEIFNDFWKHRHTQIFWDMYENINGKYQPK